MKRPFPRPAGLGLNTERGLPLLGHREFDIDIDRGPAIARHELPFADRVFGRVLQYRVPLRAFSAVTLPSASTVASISTTPVILMRLASSG
jgi:hypothetical protein